MGLIIQPSYYNPIHRTKVILILVYYIRRIQLVLIHSSLVTQNLVDEIRHLDYFHYHNDKLEKVDRCKLCMAALNSVFMSYGVEMCKLLTAPLMLSVVYIGDTCKWRIAPLTLPTEGVAAKSRLFSRFTVLSKTSE